MIDLGRSGHTEACEDVYGLGPVLGIVQDDVEDRAAK
jgi:hypothetical protein